MKQNPEKLNLLKPLLFLGAFVLIVTLLAVFLAVLNKQRAEAIRLTYTNETQQYIQQNKSQLLTLFNEVFPKGYCIGEKKSDVICADPNQDAIARLLPSTLKDWSSTAFLKKDSGKILLMRLSGDTRELYIYPQSKADSLDELLNGGVDQIPWNDYISDLIGKEVVVVVKGDSGKVVGAIIRSVIE